MLIMAKKDPTSWLMKENFYQKKKNSAPSFRTWAQKKKKKKTLVIENFSNDWNEKTFFFDFKKQTYVERGCWPFW